MKLVFLENLINFIENITSDHILIDLVGFSTSDISVPSFEYL